jgi:4a-hydroxytetrahydrobiopterin dehydratase
MERLTPEEVERRLKALPRWRREGSAIVAEFTFPDFRQALAFVNRVGDAAEARGHHPDIDIRYRRVRLALTTHDAGGLTARDLEMAQALEGIPTGSD